MARTGLGLQQLVGRLRPGDRVSSHALALDAALRAAGVESALFAEDLDPRLAARARPLAEARGGAARRLLHHPAPGAARLVVAEGGPLAVAVYRHPGEPPLGAGLSGAELLRDAAARGGLAELARRGALCVAASADLLRRLGPLGFRRGVVLPPLPDPALAAAAPAPPLLRLLSDARINLLHAGRVAPDERLEELLRVFAVYQRFVEPASRLLIAGDLDEHPGYFATLSRMADELRLDEVLFQHAPEPDELRALYAAAHVFVSLSRDEGGAGRHAEALAWGVPVVALDHGAVRERLAGAGVLVGELSHAELAELIDRVARDAELRRALEATRREAARRAEPDPLPALLAALGGLA